MSLHGCMITSRTTLARVQTASPTWKSCVFMSMRVMPSQLLCVMPSHFVTIHDTRCVAYLCQDMLGGFPFGKLGHRPLWGVWCFSALRLALQGCGKGTSACELVRVSTRAHSLDGRRSAASRTAMVFAGEDCDEDAFDRFPDSDDEVLCLCFLMARAECRSIDAKDSYRLV